MARRTQKTENQPFWSFRSIRLRIILLLAFGMAVHALLRGVLGMALVCMVQQPTNSEVDVAENTTAIYTNELKSFQVAWNMKEISAIFMFFYAGTFLSVFAAHYFVIKFGAKLIISWGILIAVLSTWALPFVVNLSPVYIIASLLRFITGLAQGFFIPCSSLLISKWFAESEKSTAMAIFTTGNQIGLAISMYCTAEMCKIRFMSGWPLAFLAYGALGFVFLALWLPFASDRPRQSTQITAIELSAIRAQTGTSQTIVASHRQYTPYAKLLFSPVILAICLSSFCQSFVMVAMTSYLPEFNRSALGLDLQQNAMWSALPFAIHFFSKLVFGFLADYAKSKHVDVDLVTKASNTISSFGCAACLLLIGFVDRPVTMLLLLCSSLSLTAGYVPGYNTSIVCIAPAFTAAISAYAQGFAQVASIMAPIAVGSIAKGSTLEEWIRVFRVLAVVLVVTGIAFLIFGSAKLQPWARPPCSHPLSQSSSATMLRPTSVAAVDRPLEITTTMALIEEERISNE